MAKKLIRKEDIEALVELVREEIEMHKQGKIDRLSTNKDVSEAAGIGKTTMWRYLKAMSEDEKKYREGKLRRENSKEVGKRNAELRKGFFSFTNKQRMNIYNRGLGKLTREQRVEHSREIGKRAVEMRKGIHSLTYEQRKEIGRKVGIKTAELKIGVHGLTREQLRETGIRSGRKTLELKRGIFGLSEEQKRENSIKALETIRNNSYFVENRFYTQSQQEGAVALLLEKYLDYKIKDGKNFQIRNKRLNNGGIDFLVNEEFLEWHPIILTGNRRGDISPRELVSYKKVLKSLPDETRKEFKEEYSKVLAINYRNSRQEAVDNSDYTGKNVIVTTNVRELYDFIRKFSNNLPSFDEFKSEFNQKVKYVKGFKVEKESKKQEAA